jgi:ElaB/YqjD/DUF883 family membrane-anchored ribosome-binding protein
MASSLIKMPGGGEENPVYLSCANLARLGDEQFQAALEWLTAEREQRRARLAEHEQVMAEARAKIVADAEAQAKARETFLESHPWEKAM